MAKQRLLYIDLMKIIGILMIVVQHLSTSYYPEIGLNFVICSPFGIGWGYLGIIVFLFTSGASLVVSNKCPRTLKEAFYFYKMRILRIYPAFWMAVIFSMIYQSQWNISYTWWGLFTTFSGFQALLGYWSGGVGVWFWFVGLIMICYILYPLLLRAMEKQPEITLISSIAISIISMAFVILTPWNSYNLPVSPVNINTIWYWFPLCWLCYFVLGMYITKKDFYPKSYNSSLTIAFLADLSFYIYLIHPSVLYISKYSIVFFALATMAGSMMLYSFDLQIKKFDPSPFIEPWMPFFKTVYMKISSDAAKYFYVLLLTGLAFLVLIGIEIVKIRL